MYLHGTTMVNGSFPIQAEHWSTKSAINGLPITYEAVVIHNKTLLSPDYQAPTLHSKALVKLHRTPLECSDTINIIPTRIREIHFAYPWRQ
jgi:hypothetical protein